MRLAALLATLLCFVTCLTGIATANNATQQVPQLQQGQQAKQAPTRYLLAGYVENVAITFDDTKFPIVLKAKLDTGADSSSLHATNIRVNKEKKEVSFSLTDQHGQERRITSAYDRIVRIKKRPSGYHRRPVIPVRLQIGPKLFDAYINLADRTNFSYKMLIGRRELRQGILVDSSLRHRFTLPAN